MSNIEWPKVLLRRNRANPTVTEILVNTNSTTMNKNIKRYVIGNTHRTIYIQSIEDGLFRHYMLYIDMEWAVEVIDTKLAEALYDVID